MKRAQKDARALSAVRRGVETPVCDCGNGGCGLASDQLHHWFSLVMQATIL